MAWDRAGEEGGARATVLPALIGAAGSGCEERSERCEGQFGGCDAWFKVCVGWFFDCGRQFSGCVGQFSDCEGQFSCCGRQFSGSEGQFSRRGRQFPDCGRQFSDGERQFRDHGKTGGGGSIRLLVSTSGSGAVVAAWGAIRPCRPVRCSSDAGRNLRANLRSGGFTC